MLTLVMAYSIFLKLSFVNHSSKFADELILPFLWAQDGFSEPSQEMADALKMGLAAPDKFSLLGGVALLGLGGVLVLCALVWLLMTKRRGAGGVTFPAR